jgi:hypothetical protein
MSGTNSFHPALREQAGAITAFLSRIQRKPLDHPDFQLAMQEWKYWFPLACWPHASRSFVLEKQGQILAHAATAPVLHAGPRGSVSSQNIVDWAARPDSPGAGLALVRGFTRLTDTFLVIGGTADAQGVFQRYPGMQPGGDASFFVRAVKPFTIARRQPSVRRWVKSAINSIRDFGPSAPPAAGWEAIELEGPPDPVGLTEGNHLPGWAPLERSPDLFRFIAARPDGEARFFRLDHQGRPAGACFLHRVRGQTRLMDVSAAAPEKLEDAYRMAVRLAAGWAGTLEILAADNIPLRQAALRAAGLRAVWPNPVLFLDPKNLLEGRRPEVNMLVGDLHMYMNVQQPYLS